MTYQSFHPSPLPPVPPIAFTPELVTKLIDTNKKLATLNGYLRSSDRGKYKPECFRCCQLYQSYRICA